MPDNPPIEEILGFNPEDPQQKSNFAPNINTEETEKSFVKFAETAHDEAQLGQASAYWRGGSIEKQLHPKNLLIISRTEDGGVTSRIYYAPNMRTGENTANFVPVDQLGIGYQVSGVPSGRGYFEPIFDFIELIHGESADNSGLETSFRYQRRTEWVQKMARNEPPPHLIHEPSNVYAPLTVECRLEKGRKLEVGFTSDGRLTGIDSTHAYFEGIRIREDDLERAESDGELVVEGQTTKGVLTYSEGDIFTLSTQDGEKVTDTITIPAKVEPDFIINILGLREFIENPNPESLPPETDAQWRRSNILREFDIDWQRKPT